MCRVGDSAGYVSSPATWAWQSAQSQGHTASWRPPDSSGPDVVGGPGSRRGGGTRVAVAARKPSARERRARLVSPTAAYVTKARALGATDAEITEALRAQPT